MLSLKNYRVSAIFAMAMVVTTLAFSLDFMQDDDIAEKLSEEIDMELEMDVELRPENGPAPLSEEAVESFSFQDSLERQGNSTGCKDVYPEANRCPGWAKAGYCTNRSYVSWMKMYCRKSCNNCNPCFDGTSYCSRYASMGYCNRPSSGFYYSAYCPVSCGTCPLKTENCDDLYPSTICSRLTRYCSNNFVANNCRKTCKACATCRDSQYSAVCSTFKAAGYCASNSTCTRRAMMSNCRKTCELC